MAVMFDAGSQMLEKMVAFMILHCDMNILRFQRLKFELDESSEKCSWKTVLCMKHFLV